MRRRLQRLAGILTTPWEHVTAWRLGYAVVILGLIVAHGLSPSVFTVDGVTLGLLGLLLVVVLAPLLESADLPGAGLKFKRDLDTLQRASDAVKADPLPPETASSAGDDLGKTPNRQRDRSPIDVTTDDLVTTVLEEAARSPRVALILLSSELERAVRQLLSATGWGGDKRRRSLPQGISRLVELGVLTPSAASALSLFTQVRNDIVHGGQAATDDEVIRAIDAGIPLLRAVRAIPRERNFVEYSDVTIYDDPQCTRPVSGVSGVILRTVSPGGITISERIFPTTRHDWTVGSEVSWEWGPSQWGECWYRHPVGDAVQQAWLGSMEFVGRPIDET